jgi:hypothetical protein
MKSRTLARLELLAAAREAQLLAALRRHAAAQAQSRQQREMLTQYRDRLAASWQDGGAIPAAQARRASQFAAGAQAAAAQIAAAEQQAGVQLSETAAALAGLAARRRKLQDRIAAAARAERARADQKTERDRPWRRA